jgi:hypothetical protein
VLPASYQTPWVTALELTGVAGAGAAAAAAQQATVAERVRVARELHDTILSDLAGLAMRLHAAAARATAASLASAGAGTAPAQPEDGLLPELRDQARRTLDETRLAVTAMRASAAEIVPLSAQLSVAAHRVFADAPVRVSVRPTGAPRRLSPDVEAEVLRVATEALVNAPAHSDCRAVAVTCASGGPRSRSRSATTGGASTPPWTVRGRRRADTGDSRGYRNARVPWGGADPHDRARTWDDGPAHRARPARSARDVADRAARRVDQAPTA